MYGYEDFKWNKKNKLYCGRRYTGIYLQLHPNHEGLYYLCLYNHKIDYYNETRARDNGIKLAMSIGNRIAEKPTQEPRTEEFRVGELG